MEESESCQSDHDLEDPIDERDFCMRPAGMMDQFLVQVFFMGEQNVFPVEESDQQSGNAVDIKNTLEQGEQEEFLRVGSQKHSQPGEKKSDENAADVSHEDFGPRKVEQEKPGRGRGSGQTQEKNLR